MSTQTDQLHGDTTPVLFVAFAVKRHILHASFSLNVASDYSTHHRINFNCRIFPSDGINFLCMCRNGTQYVLYEECAGWKALSEWVLDSQLLFEHICILYIFGSPDQLSLPMRSVQLTVQNKR